MFRMSVRAIALLIFPVTMVVHDARSVGAATHVDDPALAAFSAWLSEHRPGYGCDEGPARFRNATVEAAYPGQRFYYVLSYTRGIQPPFPNSVSLVAAVNESLRVIPFQPASPISYGRGLKHIGSARDAQLAAAAVSIVSSCGDRHWKYDPARFKVKKTHTGWKASYSYDGPYESWISFDRKGAVLAMGGSAPPVP